MPNEQIDILAIGDCSVDLYMRVADNAMSEEPSKEGPPKVCFFHGSKIPVEEFETSIAGNALNVAVAAQVLGLKTAVYTETGNDENTLRLKKELTNHGVNTEFVVENKGTPTDVHSIIVFGGERTIFSYHGKREYRLQKWEKPKCIYYTSIGKGFENFQQDLVLYLRENPEIIAACNPGTFQLKAGLESLKPFLAVTHILIINKEEAELLTETTGLKLPDYHKKLQELGPKLTVITDGSNGVSAYDGKEYIEQKSYSDNRPVVDMTGAGDAFSAAFVAAVLYGKSLEQALKWGVINSGEQIKKIGSITGLLNKQEIETISSRI